MELGRIRSLFTLLPDTPAIYPQWEKLVVEFGVKGKESHDARLIAAMNVHGISRIVTFDRGLSNYRGFRRLARTR
jgi:predicted nucleic acid-binding protein